MNDQALKYIQAVQKDADDSRAETQEAYRTLREYRQATEQELGRLVSELQKHRQLAETLTYRFRVLTSVIMSPNASVESLRELVQDPSFGGHNGAGG